MTRQKFLLDLFTLFRHSQREIKDQEWSVGHKTFMAPLARPDGFIALHELLNGEYCLRVTAAEATAFAKNDDALMTITSNEDKHIVVQLGGISGLDLRTIQAVPDFWVMIEHLLHVVFSSAQHIDVEKPQGATNGS